jgi:ArsR family transcriptional regulator
MPKKQNQADVIFKAFADKTRLRMMVLLSKGELCVGDLVSILKVPQPTASRHLAYLRRSAMVNSRKEGQWIYYRLAPARSKLQKSLLHCLECCFDEVPEVQGDEKRSKKVETKGGCC